MVPAVNETIPNQANLNWRLQLYYAARVNVCDENKSTENIKVF